MLLSVQNLFAQSLTYLYLLDARTREKVGYRESGRKARQKVKETGDFVHLFENSKSFPDNDC